MPRAASWTVTLAAVAFARPTPLKLQLHARRPPTGRAAAITLRGGSYDETYDDDWSGEGYAGGDAYDYGGAPPVDAPKQNLDVKGFVPDRKTGLIMRAAGGMATMLGISLFFEKNLIRVGNILLVLGAPIVVGPARASRYVLAPAKLRATLDRAKDAPGGGGAPLRVPASLMRWMGLHSKKKKVEEPSKQRNPPPRDPVSVSYTHLTLPTKA